MLNTQIATPRTFEGKPIITAPAIIGASPQKPILYKIPVLGKRPIRYSLTPLPEGLTLDNNTGIISGQIQAASQYKITITVENELGKASKEVLFDIKADNICQTPLMGWTSWNAYRCNISQDKVMSVAEAMCGSGLIEYGYQYVNIDSGWQGEYGGKYDAIQPKPTFPDMSKMCSDVHCMGLKIGIYSTPMQLSWGDSLLPGCTQAPLDPHYADTHFGIGKNHKEKNNVDQWCEWGFDYLKYDWRPTDIQNAGIMREWLTKCKRDFAFSVTLRANIRDKDFWMKNCSSWRDNEDSYDRWETLMAIINDSEKWMGYCVPGHFLDLDMLEAGKILCRENKLTEDEQLTAFSYRVIFPSPLQISCDVTRLSDFDLAMFCNEEIIAINQDALGAGAYAILDEKSYNEKNAVVKRIKVMKKPLEDGGYALGCFNFGTTVEKIVLPVEKASVLRDLWAKKELIRSSDTLELTLEPHTVRMIKVL